MNGGMAGGDLLGRGRRLLARLPVRLLAFNVLLVALPVAGVLFFDTYEQQLLQAQERTMVQEGRLLAAAIEADGQLDPSRVRAILVKLEQRHEARLRVVNEDARLVADSAALGPRRPSDAEPLAPEEGPREGWLYRIGSLPFRLLRGGPAGGEESDAVDVYEGATFLAGPEIERALRGRYGAVTRRLGGERPLVVFYTAIPIRLDDRIAGAVLVSQSTVRVLRSLDAVRLAVFKIFLVTLGAAVAISLVVATTIARPLAHLKRQAEAVVDRRGRLRGGFEVSDRSDEIGDLERSLAELGRRLEVHLAHTEALAGDLAHEFKNPLASIRTAAEMAADADEPVERERYVTMVQREVARLERLVSDAREVTRLDAGLENEPRREVDLEELLTGIVDGFRLRLDGRPAVVLAVASSSPRVLADADRLTQVFENLLDNAVSFSPPEGTVTVGLGTADGNAVITVGDDGPGIPPEHLLRVFDRFFSYRPQAGRNRMHSGLGLAIVRTIVEGYGGSVTAANRATGGAELTVRLPLCR